MITIKSEYSFDQFLEQRDKLDYLDNPFLQKVFHNYSEKDWTYSFDDLKAFSLESSNRWKQLIDEISRVENHPKIRHYDAYNHRIDRIIRPQEMYQLENEVFSNGLFSEKTSSQLRAMKRFLLHHNGEAGLTCPIACTDGLIALLENFKDELSPELEQILKHCKEGINGDFGIGAQFMSEIQGGSNIPANVLKAVNEGNYYRLYGNKFFCSAAHADYSVVTARIEGTDHIGVFVVPTWLKGDKEKEIRNNHKLNRLKWKLGTTELPSAEIEYEGAIAYPIGPIDKGVALAVGIVLTRSRIDIGFASAAFMMRAARESILYARFREVFDRRIDEFPMAKAQLDNIEHMAKRTTATAFKISNIFETISSKPATLDQELEIRILILLQKIFASRDTVDILKTAISIFGGHGVMEDFSSIPRLFRDAMVNELWEGPRNVLLSQIYRDLQKNKSTCPPEKLLASLLSSYDIGTIKDLQTRLVSLLQINLYDRPNNSNINAAKKWEDLWSDVFYLYQNQVLEELQDTSLIPHDVFDSLS